MAVYSNNLSGVRDDLNVCCDYCFTSGRCAEAIGFCRNCEENLCTSCIEHHKRNKALKQHILLDTPVANDEQITVQTLDSLVTCTESCNVHQNEVVKFFCTLHEAVGCNDCMTLDHRTCKIYYIPDICTGIANGQEFQNTLQDVAKRIKQSEDLEDKADSVKRSNESDIEEALRQFDQYQGQIIERLSALRRTMIEHVQSERFDRERNVDKLSNETSEVKSALKTLQLAMHESQAKNLDAQAFVIMKRAQFKMKAFVSKSYEDVLSFNRMRCVFEPNKDLEKVLYLEDGLGKFNIFIESESSLPKASLESLKIPSNIKVKTTADEDMCGITECTSPSRLLLGDWNNLKLQILDIVQQSVAEEMTLDTVPFDFAVLPQNQVAVTLPTKHEMMIMNMSEQIGETKAEDAMERAMTFFRDNEAAQCRMESVLELAQKLIQQRREHLHSFGSDSIDPSPSLQRNDSDVQQRTHHHKTMELAMFASTRSLEQNKVSITSDPEVQQRIKDLEDVVRLKDEELSRMQQKVMELSMSASTRSLVQDKVSITSCHVGDLVLLCLDERLDLYVVFTVGNTLHFLHTECLSPLGLKTESGEAKKQWLIAEVIDKEYCQAKKANNRFKVPVGTKFYRVKAKPWKRESNQSPAKKSDTASAP